MASPFIAEIIMFGGNFAPRGWAFCEGQLLPISQYSALFSLLGTTYGGDGRVTFGLPDLRGRVPMHPGTGPGLTPRSLGEKGGTETAALTTPAQLPAHTHAANCATTGTTNVAVGNYWSNDAGVSSATYHTAGGAAMNAGAIGNTGSGQGHPNVQPFQCVNFIIALQGVFPSRN